jgi:hypothetical protein
MAFFFPARFASSCMIQAIIDVIPVNQLQLKAISQLKATDHPI